MNNATNNTVTETRNAYRALMGACLKGHSDKPADFNRKVEGLMHELADGEPYEMTAEFYYRAACEVAYYVYSVNFRTLSK